MLLLVEAGLDHRVAGVPLAVLRRVLFLDLLIHAHEALLPLLPLVLLHELLEHLLCRLLPLLAYVLLDELVHTAQFLLLPSGASTWTASSDVLVAVADYRGSGRRHISRAATSAFALAALPLTGALP